MLRSSALVPFGAVSALPFVLAGCATTRQFSPLELADVALLCGVPTGDLEQDPELPKLVHLYTVAPGTAQLDCIHQWARQHRLHLAYIEAVEHQTEQAVP